MINGFFLITSVKKNTFLENQLIQDHKKQQIPHNIVQAPCRHHYILCSISNHEEKCPNPSGGKSLWRKGHTPQQTLSSVIYLIIQDRMYSNTLIFPLILQLPPTDFSHRTIVLLPGPGCGCLQGKPGIHWWMRAFLRVTVPAVTAQGLS